MDTLLTVAIVLITLAIVVQAGVLLAMYLMSRRLTGKVDGLMSESRRITAPLESVTSNLKTVSEDLTEVGKIARMQASRVEGMVSEARTAVMRPVREWSAIAYGIAEGVRVFFDRKTEEEPEVEPELVVTEIEVELEEDRSHPAA